MSIDDIARSIAQHCKCKDCSAYQQRMADRDRRDAELRDRLDALDDAQTEAALDTVLRNAPDLARKALRELSLIDADAVTDALNETGVL